MIDEQKLRELAEHASLSIQKRADMNEAEFSDSEDKRREFRRTAPAAILALLDELQSLRSERTAWRVTAENAEEKKTQLQEFSKLACRALDDCSRVLTTIDGDSLHEQDQIDELNARVTSLAVQALVLNGLIHRGQLEETP